MKFKRYTKDTVLEEQEDYLFADARGDTAIGYFFDGEPALYAGTAMEEESIVGYCKIVVEYEDSDEEEEAVDEK